MLRFHDRETGPFQKLLAPSDDLVKRVLEEDSFESIADVPRRKFACSCPRFVHITLRTQHLQGQVLKQIFSGVEREMRGVIRKRPDLKRQTGAAPARMYFSRDRIHAMMNIDGEIQQTARNEYSRQFTNDRRRRLSMIYHVVANNDVKTLIRKR